MEERKKLAFLSNSGSYSIFQFQEDVIRFMTSPRLEKYQKVIEWDAGYLVVIAKYKGLAEMEEYIDLVPILEDLSYDVDSFLSHIKEVKIREATGLKENGDTTVAHSGILSQRDIRLIQNFIKKNYKEMYLTWRELSEQDFYGKEEG